MTQQLPAQTSATIHITNGLNTLASSKHWFDAHSVCIAAEALRVLGDLIAYGPGPHDDPELLTARQREGIGNAVVVIGNWLGGMQEVTDTRIKRDAGQVESSLLQASAALNAGGNSHA